MRGAAAGAAGSSRGSAPGGRARGELRLITGTAGAGQAAEAVQQPGRETLWAGCANRHWGRGSEAGAAAGAADLLRPGLALPWQRLRERPGAAGAPTCPGIAHRRTVRPMLVP